MNTSLKPLKLSDLLAVWTVIISVLIASAKHAVVELVRSFLAIVCPSCRLHVPTVVALIMSAELALYFTAPVFYGVYRLIRFVVRLRNLPAELARVTRERDAYQDQVERLTRANQIQRSNTALFVVHHIERRQNAATFQKAATQRIAYLCNKLCTQKQFIDVLSAQNDDLSRDNNNLTERLEEFKTHCTTFANINTILNAQSKELLSIYDQQVENIELLEYELNFTDTRISCLKQRIRKLMAQGRTDKDDIVSLEQRLQRTDDRANALDNSLAKSEGKRRELDVQVEQLRQQNADREDVISQFEKRITQRDDCIEELKTEADENFQEFQEILDEKLALAARVEELEVKLAAREKQPEVVADDEDPDCDHPNEDSDSQGPFRDQAVDIKSATISNSNDEDNDEDDEDGSDDSQSDSSDLDDSDDEYLDFGSESGSDEAASYEGLLHGNRVVMYLDFLDELIATNVRKDVSDKAVLSMLADAPPELATLAQGAVGHYFTQLQVLDGNVDNKAQNRHHLQTALVTLQKRILLYGEFRKPHLVGSKMKPGPRADNILRRQLQLAGSPLPRAIDCLSLHSVVARPVVPLIHPRIAHLRWHGD
ncbi:hypothetical protein BKA62DRAFT_364556 [Auriculariales sp. MPI-PUGE-AT-0066]|nr:hypothetical protein BKA62DRAFT_364556 [Auriculariales sp. MPI-PUGE-AT-0066]